MDYTERLNKLRDASLDAAEMITQAYSPQWKTRVDVAKSLIPVTSGALVFTVAFAPSLAKATVHPAWRYCLVASWLFFLVALSSSLLSLWFSIGLHDMKANILEQSDKLRRELARPDANVESTLAVMEEVFVTANKPIERKDKVSRRLLNGAYLSYGLAILLIGLLGARQLLVF
jgi:glucan phosphoethanolaminetransferase (alkaline phosphatase superfamily)